MQLSGFLLGNSCATLRVFDQRGNVHNNEHVQPLSVLWQHSTRAIYVAMRPYSPFNKMSTYSMQSLSLGFSSAAPPCDNTLVPVIRDTYSFSDFRLDFGSDEARGTSESMVTSLRLLLLAWVVNQAFAGWPSRKGHEDSSQSWKSKGYDQWSYRGGKGSSYHQGKGYTRSSPNDALTLELLDRLTRSNSASSRDRSRRGRRHSSSRSNSRRRSSEHRYAAELRELRAYREHHEAQDRAKSEKEAKEANSELPRCNFKS